MLSKSERDAIRAREQAATKGPWEFRDGHSVDGDSIELLMAEVGRAGPDEEPEYSQVLFHGDFSDSEIQANWAFVGHARADIPALLDDLDAKDALFAEMKAERDDLYVKNAEIILLRLDRETQDKKIAEREATIAAMRKALELAIECIDLDNPGAEYTIEHDLKPALQPDAGAKLLKELRTLRIDNDRLEGLAEAQDKAIGALTASREKLLTDHSTELVELRAENQRWMDLCTSKSEEIARVTEYRNQMRVDHAAQLAAYRKALEEARAEIVANSTARTTARSGRKSAKPRP